MGNNNSNSDTAMKSAYLNEHNVQNTGVNVMNAHGGSNNVDAAMLGSGTVIYNNLMNLQ